MDAPSFDTVVIDVSISPNAPAQPNASQEAIVMDLGIIDMNGPAAQAAATKA
ncbi:unnamed protein product, partial [Aphanomyces euteiches]